MGADVEKTANDEEQVLAGLVVIGSSAGGVDAVLSLVSSLPAGFPAAVVIAQHIDPRRPSLLGELVSYRTALRVVTVSDDNEALAPGVVYVVPADRDVEISDHHIVLRDVSAVPAHPSVDRLMASAARGFGEDLVGVILTGTGSDGAAGALAIKGHGGSVIIQNPDSSEYAAMPASVPRSAVDMIAELDAIGPLLVELFSDGASKPFTEQDDDFSAFLNHIRELSGIDFGSYKRPTIERRLRRRMVAVGATTLTSYRRFLESRPEEMTRLVTSFLIKVTRFFRDPDLYAHLRDHLLPALIEKTEDHGELRIWSAGCATGEEAYTVAMLVTDLLAEHDKTFPVRIFATDVAVDAVDFARHGVYPESALEDMPAELIERHFHRRDGTFEVRKSVRSHVVFGEHDLSRRAPFPRIDLVLCRNVFIYFTPELQRRSLQLFAYSLNAGGFLVLGKAESVSSLPEFFALHQPRLKIFRRVDGPAPIPADRIVDAATFRPERRRNGIHRQEYHPPRPASRQTTITQAAPLLDALSSGIAIVDRNYDIQMINAGARRMLGVLGAGTGEDLVHRVTPVLAEPVKTAIDSAFRGERSSGMYPIPPDVELEGGRDLSLTCTPVPAAGGADPIETVVLEVVDVTAFAGTERNLVEERDRTRSERDQFQDRAERAIAELRELRAAHQEAVGQHGQLRAENEQLQVASEEAQAAAEEIETLSEEQQATNEELETLNEELQATVEELNTTNSDLESRAIELEELAATLAGQRSESESARRRVEAILANMADAVMVVDAGGNVMQTNAAWTRMLGPVDEFAPEDETGRQLPSDDLPQQRAIRGESFMMQFSLTDPDKSRRWFEAHSQPVQREDDGAPWGVVVVRDITERSLRRMQERFLAVASHELRTPLTSLSGSLQLIARRMPVDDAGDNLTRHVIRAREQMRRLETLIGELTDVARLQGGMFHPDRQPVDLAYIARGSMETALPITDGMAMRLDAPPEPVMVTADAYRLEQVLINLIINAHRHANSAAGIEVRIRPDEGMAVIDVQDYGRGIADDALPDIFSQFYQSGHEDGHPGKGLGLGLFIAREIIAAHDGSITARSIVGDGTTFEIRLPLLADS